MILIEKNKINKIYLQKLERCEQQLGLHLKKIFGLVLL
uniref:Uncharacterized protein n=1 Tax=Siphoviridae sp. ctkzC12 TaxID=2826446 RepID=A0A8S5LVU2_9CAUD|nr:MAG TPA: hypothetical protein [Siphoviridae sp. ctkzC12]